MKASPELFPVLSRDVRRVLVNRFPYGIYYRIESEEIIVFAVMHAARDPRVWQTRG
jgi:plasmid stabilization system protein ParE